MSARIVRASLHPYRLPLRRPWRFATHRLESRSGWLVSVEDNEGHRGWGESAPLPQAGTEHPETTGAWLKTTAEALTGCTVDTALGSLPAAGDAPPAARCGVESALLDLLARRAGQPLAAWLVPGASHRIEVNAALGSLAALEPDSLESSLKAGFRCLKLKLGCAPPGEEKERLLDLSKRLPDGIRLRLDANRSWDPASAQTLLADLPAERIELVEEPLADPSPRALNALAARCPFPLALDESLTHATADRWLSHPAPACLVLKPMRLGGLLPCLALARRARAAGKAVLVTGMLDATPATLAAAHLAAALDRQGSPRAHGLATVGWLARDLAPTPRITAGRLHLPAGPGAGCIPFPEVIRHAP